MSVAEIKAEMDRLSLEEQEELRMYMRVKFRPMDERTRLMMTEKLNDPNPARWLTLDEVMKRLGDA